MARLMLIVFLILNVFSPTALYASGSWWEDGCDPRAIELIDPATNTFDYAAVCVEYRACDPHGQGDTLCQTRALASMLQTCAADDAVCEKTAILYAAALLAFDMPFGESIAWEPPQSVIEGVPEALAAFEAEDYQAALAAYQRTPPEDFEGDTSLPISRAVVYEMLGDTDTALAEYATVFQIAFAQPLAWYARSQLYGAMGRSDEASWDALAFAELTKETPELTELANTLTARYPLAEGVVQDWLLYPVLEEGIGVAGDFFIDKTLEAPRPVRLGIYPNAALLVGATNWSMDEGPDQRRVQVLPATENGSFSLTYPNYWENSGALRLTPHQNTIYLGSENIGVFEGGARWDFLLAPVDAPDPREQLDGTRHCPGSVISRLKPGMTVISSRWEGRFQVFETPDGLSLGLTEAMTITDGPQCVENATWWQGQDENGLIGWIMENEGADYLLNSDGNNRLVYCPGAPKTRLFVGAQGTVVPGLGANNLRADSDLESEVVGQIAEGTVFTVLNGPVCADGYAWWNVSYNGIAGWSAEGEGSTYWLSPAG